MQVDARKTVTSRARSNGARRRSRAKRRQLDPDTMTVAGDIIGAGIHMAASGEAFDRENIYSRVDDGGFLGTGDKPVFPPMPQVQIAGLNDGDDNYALVTNRTAQQLRELPEVEKGLLASSLRRGRVH